jgi:ATP-dependent Zn protease
MVTRYGMNEQIGPVSVDMSDPATSPETKRLVEREVPSMLARSYDRAVHAG